MRNLARWALIGLLPALALTILAGLASDGALLAQPHVLPSLLLVGAIGKYSDLVIYNEEYQTGLVESMTQFLTVFNEGSRGAIRLIPRALKGHYAKGAFFKNTPIVTRRDIASTAAVTAIALTQDENISVKINRKIGPVAHTLDAMKKAGLSEADASRAFGVMAGEQKMRDMLNTAILAVETALEGTAALTLNITGETNKTLTPAVMARALAKMGDNSQKIVAWLTHSKPNFDIVGSMLGQNVTGLTDVVAIQGRIPGWLGRPAILTDAPPLTDLNGSLTDTYNVLGLTEGAVTVTESEDETYFTDLIGGAENLYRLFQAEYAYNVEVKGYKYDVTAGINPTDSTLGTTSTWDLNVSDVKSAAGVRVVVQ